MIKGIANLKVQSQMTVPVPTMVIRAGLSLVDLLLILH